MSCLHTESLEPNFVIVGSLFGFYSATLNTFSAQVHGTGGTQPDASLSSSERFDNTKTYAGKFIFMLRHIYIHIRWHRLVADILFRIRLNPMTHGGIKPGK